MIQCWTPVDLDGLDELCIDPLVSDERAGRWRWLARAIQGKGAFRRFKNELHEEFPDLLPAWNAFGDSRARRRAVDWLADNSLIDDQAATQYFAAHPDPDLP